MILRNKRANLPAAAAVPSARAWPRGFFAVYRQEKMLQNVPCGTLKKENTAKNMKKHKKVRE
jgi:hypothetical protein